MSATGAGEQFRAAHLLIKFSGSRNPVSRRTNESTANVTYETALKEIQEVLASIQAGKISFEDAAAKRSDCSSYRNNGDLGFFGPGEMVKPFEDAVRALAVGEMSSIVQTESGLHIIKRLA